jgi:hypothetical protein
MQRLSARVLLHAVLRVAAAAVAIGVAVGCAPAKDDERDDPSLAVTHDEVTLEACGSVVAYAPATASRDGTLELDVRAWTVAAGTEIAGSSLLVADTAVCVSADLDPARKIIRATIRPAPTDPWTAAGLE